MKKLQGGSKRVVNGMS